MRPWLEGLAEVATVTFFDHRATGRSPFPEDAASLTHQTWVADIDKLRQKGGHEKIVLFGHSYGGYFALEYALRYPEHLAGLILCNTAPAFDYAPDAIASLAARATPHQVELVTKGLSEPTANDESLRDLYLDIFETYFFDYKSEFGDAIRNRTSFSATAFNRAYMECLAGYDVSQRLGEIKAPCLVVAGRHDWITPVDQAERLNRGIVDSELLLFESSGHFPFMEENQGFVAAISSWISGLENNGKIQAP